MTRPVSAFIAANRFGLGAAPGELAAASIDPKAWLKSQLAATPETPAALAELLDPADLYLEIRRMVQPVPAVRVQPGALAGPAKPGPAKSAPREAAPSLIGTLEYERYASETTARLIAQVQSRQPLRECLVAFWSNHFTVSVDPFPGRIFAAAFEREAIRPHVTGRFLELLGGAVHPPAMLFYLDNAVSTGPHSRVGLRRDMGL